MTSVPDPLISGRATRGDGSDPRLQMQRQRRKTNASFIASYDFAEQCATCFLPMNAGERIRYNPEGFPVHHGHRAVDPEVAICTQCWLAKPCDCP